jgi:hypothetical protein
LSSCPLPTVNFCHEEIKYHSNLTSPLLFLIAISRCHFSLPFIDTASDLDVVDKVHDNEEKKDEPPATIPPEVGGRSLKKADKKALKVSSRKFNPRNIGFIESWPSNDAHVFTSPNPRQQEKAPGQNATCSTTSPSKAADERRPPDCQPVFWDGPSRHKVYASGGPPQGQFS